LGILLLMMNFKNLILYGLALAALLVLLQLLEFKLLIINHATEIYVTTIAILFTALGVWMASKIMKPKTEVKTETVVVEKEIVVYQVKEESFKLNKTIIQQLGISQRELEVLQLIAEGNSNQEIAEKLFLSLHTIKTHTSRLFEKLDVKRRTQAIEKAKRLNIIP
jgi:two-component system, NarL family, response regulator LiaR